MSESTEITNTATTKAVKPVVDPEYLNSLPTAFRLWANAVKLNIDTCQPCVVTAYDRATHRATVKPLVLRESLITGEKFAANTMNVSVWRWMSGGYVIDAPIQEGDTGWVIASDRNAIATKNANTALTAAGAVSPTANDRASHILNAGFFIPDSWGKLDVPSIGDAYKTGFAVAHKSDALDSEGNVVYDQVVSLTDDGLYLRGKKTDGSYATIILRPNDITKNSSDISLADFHNVTLPTGKTTTDDDGKVHLKTHVVKVLADYSDNEGDDIVLPVGTLENVTISAISNASGISFSAIRSESDSVIHYDLVIGENEDDDDEDDNYCNSISSDGDMLSSGAKQENSISDDSSSMSGSSDSSGGGSSDESNFGNAISYTPCDY